MRVLLTLCALTALAGCNEKKPAVPDNVTDTGAALDKQAIAAGLLPDPRNLEFAGRFETRNDLGTDKFCAVGDGAEGFRVGLLAISGAESKCEGQGIAQLNGGTVRISLQGRGKCEIDAQYDGVELRFPGSLEPGCAAYCTPQASLSGTHYFMVQPGDEAARRTLGRNIERLCG